MSTYQTIVTAKENRKPDNEQTLGLRKVSTALPPRFFRKLAFRPDGCWIWLGGVNKHAFYPKHFYGIYCRDGRVKPPKLVYAHRFSYEVHKGPIPEGMDVDHLCHNKLCVNPEHLEAVTHKENIRRRDARKRVSL